MARLFVLIRLLLGLMVVAFAAVLQTVILLVLLPSRKARILSCIVFMRITGTACLWLSGCHLTLSGREHLDGGRPAIYVLNHTSILDLFHNDGLIGFVNLHEVHFRNDHCIAQRKIH